MIHLRTAFFISHTFKADWTKAEISEKIAELNKSMIQIGQRDMTEGVSIWLLVRNPSS